MKRSHRPLDIGQMLQDAFFGYNPLEKTVTFLNTAADVSLFTVTGAVIVKIIPVCTTDVESAGGATVALGVTGDLDAMISVTDCTLLEADELWIDQTPTTNIEPLDSVREYMIAGGKDIILDVETAKQVDSGVLEFYLWWAPISTNGKVVVA